MDVSEISHLNEWLAQFHGQTDYPNHGASVEAAAITQVIIIFTVSRVLQSTSEVPVSVGNRADVAGMQAALMTVSRFF